MKELSETKSISPAFKFALELGPLVVFFLANRFGERLANAYPIFQDLGGPLFIATAAFMVATIISLAVSWVLTRTIPAMPLVSGVVVMVFGALTLYLQDETFIKMKPTIVNGLFAALLFGGLFFGRSLLKLVFSAAFEINDIGWHKLTIRWAWFFVFMAILNEIIWRNTSTDFWVAFKVWGNMPLSIAFMMFQIPLLQRYALNPEPKAETEK
ncbi:MAG: septation protein A [Ahrensia sp.]|nr:septation protein A [Ahrensia sp.]